MSHKVDTSLIRSEWSGDDDGIAGAVVCLLCDALDEARTSVELARGERNTEQVRAEAAERQVAALRDALTEAEDAVEMVIVGIEANHPRYWSSAAAYAEAMEACRTASIPRLTAIRVVLADTAKAAEGWFSEAEIAEKVVEVFHAYSEQGFKSPHPAVHDAEAFALDLDAALRSARGGK